MAEDSITGSSANDIIQSGTPVPARNGGAGNDLLRGTEEADVLDGGDNNDVLVGRAGDDVLNGGNDQNIYLPGAGADTVNGGSGLDIVFFEGDRSTYGTNGCSKTSCTLTQNDKPDKTLQNVEILIFNDARLDLHD